MKPSKILREAAKHIEKEQCLDQLCGCDVIQRKCKSYQQVIDTHKYFSMVAPKRKEPFRSWWGKISNESYQRPSNVNARIIGLCLAAAIAESEGD